MNYQVEISKRAEENLDKIAKYLEQNFSNSVKMDFLIKISEHLQLLEIMPYMNRKSAKQENIRECIVNKQTIMFYRITENIVEIITIQNSRMNLDDLKF